MVLLLGLLGLGCLGPPALPDLDADGYASDDDCNDQDASIHPDADETCNGRDDNCDGDIDGAIVGDAVDAGTWYADADADGYGDAGVPVEACDAPVDYVDDATDCDDATPLVNPGPRAPAGRQEHRGAHAGRRFDR